MVLVSLVTVDLGCGTYCRGDIGIDIQFWFKNPYDIPELFNSIMGGLNPLCDKVMSDLNYGLPLRSNSVDVIVARAILEHLLRPYELLKEVKRVLRKGGVLKLSVPNARVSEADWRDPSHFFSFTVPTIRNLVTAVLKVTKVQLIMNDEEIYVEAVKW